MFIRLLNHFVHDTPLNSFLQKRSYFRYQEELQKLVTNYNQQGKKLPEKFVVFNFPRSGSNLLCTMLDNHPDILCHQELFNPGRIFYSRDFPQILKDSGFEDVESWQDLIHGRVSFSTKRQRDFNPEEFLMKIWDHNNGASVVGFNLFPTHAPNMAPSLLRDKDVRKILLVRKNKLKCYVSRAVARKTNVWADFSKKSSNSSNTQQIKVNINAHRLIDWSRKYDEYFQYLRQELSALNQPFLEISYEDLIGADKARYKAELLTFIKAPPNVDALQPSNRRQTSNKQTMSDLISNYKALKTELRGTELEAFCN